MEFEDKPNRQGREDLQRSLHTLNKNIHKSWSHFWHSSKGKHLSEQTEHSKTFGILAEENIFQNECLTADSICKFTFWILRAGFASDKVWGFINVPASIDCIGQTHETPTFTSTYSTESNIKIMTHQHLHLNRLILDNTDVTLFGSMIRRNESNTTYQKTTRSKCYSDANARCLV